MRRHLISILLGTFLIPFFTSAAQDSEKKISRADLPEAVRKTVDAEAKGATIRDLSKETEKGQTYYEVSLTVNSHRKDILIDSAGRVVEIEQEVALDALPQDVRKGLEAKAGKGKITKVESLTKGGKLIAYEATVQTGTKKSEILFHPKKSSSAHQK